MTKLQVNTLCKEYPTRDKPLVVLRNATFSLSSGENLAIIGPSGSGKSTLLHLLGLLETPTSGSYKLDGKDPFALSEPEAAQFRNQYIGFIFQEHHLLPQFSVLENVLTPALAEGKVGPDAIARAQELIQRVGLKDRTEHRPSELSGGERQRVAVARALLHRPPLLLADEPTGSLDHDNAQLVAKILFDLQREEETMLVLVTHSQQLASQMQRQLAFQNGELLDAARVS